MNTTIYNPANKRKEQLIDEFVVRTDEYQLILDDLRSFNGNEVYKHHLIIGQRGSGKTTLIHRIKYAIEGDSALNELIPIALGEEQYGISELMNLWEKVGEILEDYFNFRNLYNEMQDEIETSNEQQAVFSILLAHIENEGRKVVLFIDNFGDLLDKFSDQEINSLKKILKTCSFLRIIAASPIAPYNLPESYNLLFKLFKKIPLKGLSNNEIKTLLLKLSESDSSKSKIQKIINQHPERIEILRLLTGGVTRTIVSLYKIFIDNVGGKSIRDLQLTLDAVTPLYKHNMDDLPKNQQKIVDVIAKSWDATSVKEISKNTRIESKVISAQIRQLEKKQIIEKIPTDTKNHLYQIKERFFNIWYLMRYGRKHDRKRVIWLVRFLESWCSKEELENRISSHISYLQSGQYDEEAASLLGEAYLACKSIGVDLKKELLSSSIKFLPENLTKGLGMNDSDLFKTAFEHYKKSEYSLAIKNALEIKDEKIYGFLADNYLRADDIENALKYSDLLLKTDYVENVDYAIRGAIFHEMKNYENAIESFKLAIEKGYENVYTELGVVYKKNNQFELAEKTFLKGLELECCKTSSAHQLGHLYEIQNDKPKAIKFFKQAIEEGNEKGNLCLARLYDKNDDVENAIVLYKKSLKKYPDEASIGLSILYFENDNEKDGLLYLDNLKKTENNKIQYIAGRIYDKYTDATQKSIFHYNKAIELGNKDAYHRLGHVFAKLDDFDNAEKSFLSAYELNKDYGALLCLVEFYHDNNVSKEKALNYIADAKEHIKFENRENSLLAVTLLWNDKLEKSIETIRPVLNEFSRITEELPEEKDYNNFSEHDSQDDDDSEWDYIIDYFVELISYGFYQVAYDLLKEYDLSEILKPIYFALMNFMKEQYPSEYLKMGEEVREVVEDIVADILEKKQNRKK